MGPRNHVLDGGPVVLRDIATATNFVMHIVITGFVGYDFGCMIVGDKQLIPGVGFRGQAI